MHGVNCDYRADSRSSFISFKRLFESTIRNECLKVNRKISQLRATASQPGWTTQPPWRKMATMNNTQRTSIVRTLQSALPHLLAVYAFGSHIRSGAPPS
jgi:hypothetical protein